MAAHYQSTSSSHAVKLWAKKAFTDAVKATFYGKLRGKSDRSIVQIKDELSKQAGDKITFRLRSLPVGLGVQDNETLEGNEEAIEYQNFGILLGEKRYATQVEMNMTPQRTLADVRLDAKAAVQEWLEEYLDTTFFEYLTGLGRGATALISKYHRNGVLGGNLLNTPSSDRVVYGGTATAYNNIQSTDKMSLTVIDKLREKITLASPTMRPGNFGGQNAYILIMHPYQVYDLRTNTSTGQWLDIQKAAMMGGKVTENPIFNGALGMYNDMLLFESTRIPTYADAGAGANVSGARAVCLGAQAAVVAHGQNTDEDGVLKIVEKSTDYEKYLGIGITLIWGMMKSRFSSQSDFATFAVDTAAAAH